MLFCEHASRRHRGHRRPQLVLEARDYVAFAFQHCRVARLGDVGGSAFLGSAPTLVSRISALSKNSVSVGPGIRQLTVTLVSFSSLRSAQAKLSRKALVPL